MDKYDGMRRIYNEEKIDEGTSKVRKLEMSAYSKKGNIYLIVFSLLLIVSFFLSFTNIKIIDMQTTGDTAVTTSISTSNSADSYLAASFRYLTSSEEDLVTSQTKYYQENCQESLLSSEEHGHIPCIGNSIIISNAIHAQYSDTQGFIYALLIGISAFTMILSPLLIIGRAIYQLRKNENRDFSIEKYVYLLPIIAVMILVSTVLHANQFGFGSRESLGIGGIAYSVLSLLIVFTALFKNRLGNNPKRKVAKMDTEIKTSLVNFIAIVIAFILLMLPLFKVVINTQGLAIGGEYRSYMYQTEKYTFLSKENDLDLRTIDRVRSELGMYYINVDRNKYSDELNLYSDGSGWIEILYQSDIDNHQLTRILAHTSYYASRVLIIGLFIGMINIFGGAFSGRGTIRRYTSFIIAISGLVYIAINFLNKAMLIFTGNGLEDSAFQYNTSLSSYLIIFNIVFIIFYNSLSSNNSRIISSFSPIYN